MSAISSLSANAAYCTQQVLSFVKTSLWSSGPGLLPIWNVISSVIQLAEARFPLQMFADEIDDSDGTDFILTADNDKQIADRIIAKRVTIINGSDSEKAEVRGHMRTAYVAGLKRDQVTLTRLAGQMGLSNVHLCISLPEDCKDIVSQYECHHDRFSQDGAVIQYYPLMAQVTIDNAQRPYTMQMQLQTGQAYSADPDLANKKKEFVYAHELTHASRYHVIQRTALNGLAAIVNTAMWAYRITTGGFSVATLISAAPQIMLVHAIFTVAMLGLSRLHEMQADKGAMDALASNEGAIAFFEPLTNNPADLLHPSRDTRLAHAQNWQKKAV